MASTNEIMHRFANKDFGKYGSLQGSSVSISGRNYYSYSTIFGQWVDLEKNVCLVYIGDTSVTSHRHQLHDGYFPDDVHVLPYDDGGRSSYYWHGCNLTGGYDVDAFFNVERRMELID